MRTTLQVDDDVLAAARVLADERGISIGAALSDLARRGLGPRTIAEEHGLPVFAVDDDAAPLTPAMVREAAEEP
jgi:hypothetical protein